MAVKKNRKCSIAESKTKNTVHKNNAVVSAEAEEKERYHGTGKNQRRAEK